MKLSVMKKKLNEIPKRLFNKFLKDDLAQAIYLAVNAAI